MKRLRAYLSDLREGFRLMPAALRIVFSEKFWAEEIQRLADRMYTARHFDEWERWAEEARARREEG